MLEGILRPFGELTWIQAFHSAKIVGNGAMQLSHTEFKDQNTSNAMVPTSPKTIANLGGVVRQITRLTLWGWKQRKESHVLILSNAQTVMEITKQIPINVCFRDTGSTGSGNKGNILRSMKIDPSRFVLGWTANFNNDCEESQNSFA